MSKTHDAIAQALIDKAVNGTPLNHEEKRFLERWQAHNERPIEDKVIDGIFGFFGL